MITFKTIGNDPLECIGLTHKDLISLLLGEPVIIEKKYTGLENDLFIFSDKNDSTILKTLKNDGFISENDYDEFIKRM